MKKPHPWQWCPVCRSFYRGLPEQKCPQWGKHSPPAEWFWDDEELPDPPAPIVLDLADDYPPLEAIQHLIDMHDAWEDTRHMLGDRANLFLPWDPTDN